MFDPFGVGNPEWVEYDSVDIKLASRFIYSHLMIQNSHEEGIVFKTNKDEFVCSFFNH